MLSTARNTQRVAALSLARLYATAPSKTLVARFEKHGDPKTVVRCALLLPLRPPPLPSPAPPLPLPSLCPFRPFSILILLQY